MTSPHRLTRSYKQHTPVVLGIVSALKPHKLAWLLNRYAKLNLRCCPEKLRVEATAVSFSDRTEHMFFSLVKNGLITEEGNTLGYVVAPLVQFDFFLWIEDQTQTFKAKDLCKTLRAMDIIQYVVILSNNRWKQHYDRLMEVIVDL